MDISNSDIQYVPTLRMWIIDEYISARAVDMDGYQIQTSDMSTVPGLSAKVGH